MAAIDKVKILVVGDSGVGKTSLTHLLCHSEPTNNPPWTIGCSVEVKLHEYKAGTPSEKTYFIEFWDVGGYPSHENSRLDFDPEQYAGNQIPILVIGTKTDMAQKLRENVLSRSYTMAEECGADEIHVDCKQVKYFAPGSSNSVKLSKFFDKVIEKKYYSRDNNQGYISPPQDRRRFVKSTHND